MELLLHSHDIVGKFSEYYNYTCENSEEEFHQIQHALDLYVSLFDKDWDYSLNLPNHLEMWRFFTDHLIRWLTVPNVRYDIERSQTTIDALRCVTRMNCSKKQFDGWLELYKIMRFYTKNAKLQFKSLSLLYNLCIDENNKQTFITTRGMYALIHIFKNHMDDTTILCEMIDLVGSLAAGRTANYRWYSLQKSNVIPYILLSMNQHPLDKKLQNKACNVLHLLAHSEPMEIQIVKLGGQELVCKALSNHGIKNAVIALQSLIKLSTSHVTFREDRFYGIRFVVEMFQRHATDLKMLTELVKLVNHLATYHPSVMVSHDTCRLPSPLATRLVKDEFVYSDISIPFDVKTIEEEIEKPFVANFESPFDEREHMYGKEDTHDDPYLPIRNSSLFILGVRGPMRPQVLLRSSSSGEEIDNDASLYSTDSDEDKNRKNDKNSTNDKNTENVKNVLENPKNLVDIVIRLVGIVDDEIVFQAIREMAKISRVAYELICLDVIRHVIHSSFANEELPLSVLSLLITNFPLNMISVRECHIPEEIVSLLKDSGYDIRGLLPTIFGREVGCLINESLHYSDRLIQFLILCGVSLSEDFRSKLESRNLKLYQHVQHHFATNMKNVLNDTTSIPTDINQMISQFLFY